MPQNNIDKFIIEVNVNNTLINLPVSLIKLFICVIVKLVHLMVPGDSDMKYILKKTCKE